MNIGNKEYEEALSDKNNTMIMNCVCYKFVKSLNKDELYQCKLMALWKALKSWQPEKGRKFTTFLYQKLYWECIKEVNAKYNNKYVNVNYCEKKTYDELPMFEMLDGLNEDIKDIVQKKYIDMMTLQEIGNEYGCSYETIRKKIKKAINQLKT